MAVPWSRAEEFWGQADPGALAGFLTALAGLARSAEEAGRHVYCWVCV